MLAIPFPLFIAEIIIFIFASKQWGFLNTLGLYLLPCLLGLFIVTTLGRMAMLSLQTSVLRGQLPASKILHSGALFLSGLLFLIPSFFARVIALVLFLPGLRHLAVWRFKLYMAKQIAKGASSFNFSGGPFGFGGGTSGFKYYSSRGGFGQQNGFGEKNEEREVREAEVLDVTPLEITHEKKEKGP